MPLKAFDAPTVESTRRRRSFQCRRRRRRCEGGAGAPLVDDGVLAGPFNAVGAVAGCEGGAGAPLADDGVLVGPAVRRRRCCWEWHVGDTEREKLQKCVS